MDNRLKLLSYSALLTLHSCPRKFQLYRLSATQDEAEAEAKKSQNVTFAFGHAVGEGIQMVLSGASEEEILLTLFLGWYADLEDRNEKQGKSFYLALAAVQKFIALRKSGYLEGYKLLSFNGKPACELSFRITLPDNFTMRGSVDAVLQHEDTGEVIVIECKTTSDTTLNPAKFKNSSQAIGYSVVLDVICPSLSSYKVIYLVYMTKSKEYEHLEFIKSYLHRANWIQELLLDIETIKLYEDNDHYPMRGESCYQWYRECEYLNVCGLDMKHLETKNQDSTDLKIYDINLNLNDLLIGQLKKTGELKND